MDFLERMNLAMDYIESNLSGEINYQELALLIGCSEYHLSRIFPFITGQGLGLYIRRRRMSRAAIDLQKSNVDLLRISVNYGYSSVDSFSRAFKEVHGASPSTIMSGRHSVRSYSRLTFSIVIKGAEAILEVNLRYGAFRNH